MGALVFLAEPASKYAAVLAGSLTVWSNPSALAIMTLSYVVQTKITLTVAKWLP